MKSLNWLLWEELSLSSSDLVRARNYLSGLVRITVGALSRIEKHNVVIIGAGSAGLSTSYFLAKLGLEHVIIERGIVGNTWETERWDGFYLVNPNWAIRLPGFHYVGTNPEGYLSKQETVQYLSDYAKSFCAPVRTGISVNSLERVDSGYLLSLARGEQILANCVVVATGAFGAPSIPEFAGGISSEITQIHSAHYKNPESLRDGAVLVVGSGQSGAQIAEELHEAGRKVYLSVSKAGRRPRRYRGRDSSWWNFTMGNFDKTVDNVESVEKSRYGASAHTSGAKGGHDIYLRQLSKQGVELLGPVIGASKEYLALATTLTEILKAVDDHPVKWKANVDTYIEANGIQAPPDDSIEPPHIQSWPTTETPEKIELRESGIETIIWSTGFKYDFDWIKLPITDERNYPNQRRGVTEYPGLYFIGLQWMYGSKSAQFIGVGEDAEYIANNVASRFG